MIVKIFRAFIEAIHDFKLNCCELFFNGLSPSENVRERISPNPITITSQKIGCDDSIDLYQFIRSNAPLFTIIGITGTMLSLIPTFLEKFIGYEWINQLLTDYYGVGLVIFIELVIVCSALFILLIAILLGYRLWKSPFNQECLHIIYGYEIRKGFFQKILFCVIFYPLIFSFTLFVAAIPFTQDDPYLKFFASLIFVFLYLVLLFILLFALVVSTQETICWKNTVIFILLLSFVGFWCLTILILLPVTSQFDPYSNQSYGEVEIIPLDHVYSIENSQSLGLPLIIGGYYRNLSDYDRAYYTNFHWTTNYGYFISNDPSDHLVKKQGSDFSQKNASSTIFWTYDVRDQDVTKPPVIISLAVENIRTKKILNGTSVKMQWCKINEICINEGVAGSGGTF